MSTQTHAERMGIAGFTHDEARKFAFRRGICIELAVAGEPQDIPLNGAATNKLIKQ